MENYRIDRAYETVYEWNENENAYVFLCTFFEIGATSRNRDKTIIKKIKEWNNAI